MTIASQLFPNTPLTCRLYVEICTGAANEFHSPSAIVSSSKFFFIRITRFSGSLSQRYTSLLSGTPLVMDPQRFVQSSMQCSSNVRQRCVIVRPTRSSGSNSYH